MREFHREVTSDDFRVVINVGFDSSGVATDASLVFYARNQLNKEYWNLVRTIDGKDMGQSPVGRQLTDAQLQSWARGAVMSMCSEIMFGLTKQLY